MKANRGALAIAAMLLTTLLLSACGGGENESSGKESDNAKGNDSTTTEQADNKPFPLSLVVNQVGEIPSAGNEIEQAIMKYTNTELSIQWIPESAYDEKVNVMIASDELPTVIKLGFNPTIVSALKSDLFWEIGPYLNEYKNLTAQNKVFYDNISVDGKVYGVPLFRELGRATLHYRQDWFDSLQLTTPKTLDDWYNIMKAIGEQDPDKNGQRDTYGMLLDKKYNQGAASTLTRLSVTQGGPNKWAVENGEFVPEFMTKPFQDTLLLFRKLYAEKLINQDFAVVDATEIDKVYESGRSAMRISGGNAQSIQDKLVKNVPTALTDVAPLEGGAGRRLPGESGNAGFLAIPKATVKTEADLKRALTFIDQLMDPQMATLLVKGIQDKHWVDKGEFTEPLDKEGYTRDVKPYRDTLPQRGENYNIDKPSKEADLFRKNQKIGGENEQFIVTNPALNLESATYSDRGSELEQMITDAETKFIMGQIDEAGWQKEIENWKSAGGEQMMKEYKEAYANSNK